jgi:nitroreductase
MNAQSWYFYVVNNIEKNKAIGQKIHAVAQQTLQFVKDALKTGVSNGVFYDAPAVVYCCVAKDGGDLKQFDLGLAVENMMLVAQELGLTSVPVALAKFFGADIIKKEVGIADEHEFFLALPIGYRASDAQDAPKPRKPDVIKYIE